jgi:hypothetical protein
MNKVRMTTERISKRTFSFFDRKAIHEILTELIPIRIMEIIRKVLFMYDKPGNLSKKAVDKYSRKKTVIVLKYMLCSCFCLVK